MKLDIKKGDFYLLNGPAKVKVDSGLLECIAAPGTEAGCDAGV